MIDRLIDEDHLTKETYLLISNFISIKMETHEESFSLSHQILTLDQKNTFFKLSGVADKDIDSLSGLIYPTYEDFILDQKEVKNLKFIVIMCLLKDEYDSNKNMDLEDVFSYLNQVIQEFTYLKSRGINQYPNIYNDQAKYWLNKVRNLSNISTDYLIRNYLNKRDRL